MKGGTTGGSSPFSMDMQINKDSSAEGTTIEPIDTQSILPMMIFMDPPSHDVQRKLVSRAFTPRAITELEPFVRATAIECLEPLRLSGCKPGEETLIEKLRRRHSDPADRLIDQPRR